MKREDLVNGIKAGYSFFYVRTYEMDRCIEEIKSMLAEVKEELPMTLASWDFEAGSGDGEGAGDPDSALELIDSSPPWTVCLLQNFNWFLLDAKTGQTNYKAVQMIQNRQEFFSQDESRKIVVILSEVGFDKAIPKAIEKVFLSLDFGLPGEEEIGKALDFIIFSTADNERFQKPTDQEREDIILSLKGLTLTEVKAALAFSLVKHGGKFNTKTLTDIRDQGLEKIPGIKVVDCEAIDADKVKGLPNLKAFVLKAIQGKNRHLMKGIMLLGPPGVGKTMFFKWLSKVTGLRLYMIEVAELFGGLVGQSEELMRTLLDTLPLLAPAICVFDEIEKGLAGMKGGGGDGGTTKRSMGQLLKFMSDERPDRLHIFATCNDITSMPPEWIRPGRWDSSAFFIDLPTDEEKAEILVYYKKIYSVKGDPSSMDGWSGAEIEAVCRIASLLESDIDEVEDYICPVSKTMETEITSLRKWSVGKTIPATKKILKNGSKKRAIKI